MPDEEKAAIEALRFQFERQVAERDGGAYATATKYIAALTALLHTCMDGRGADPRGTAQDVAGMGDRTVMDVAWAEAERHRVRAALSAIA